MALLTLERGRDYDFLIRIDQRYTLRLSDLFCMKFGCLEEIVKEAEKKGIDITDGKFYIPQLSLNAISPKELSIYYFLLKSGKEAAKIRIVD
jgi:hypothetical protein